MTGPFILLHDAQRSRLPIMQSMMMTRRLALPAPVLITLVNGALAAMTLLVAVIQARALAPEGRGLLAIYLLWPMVFAQLGLMGVHLFLAREAGRLPDAAARLYRAGYLAMTLSGIMMILAWFAFEWFAGAPSALSDAPLIMALAALIIPASAWNTLQAQMEIARGAVNRFCWIRASFTLPYLLVNVSLWLAGATEPRLYLLGYVAVSLLAAGTSWLGLRSTYRTLPHLAEDTLNSAWRPLALWRQSWPFALSATLLSLATMIDRILINGLFDARAMGLYVVALALSQVGSIVAEGMSPLFFARASKGQSLTDLDPLWLTARLRQSVLVNLLVMLGVMAASPVLLDLLFGPAFSGSLGLALLLIPAIGLRTMMRPFEESLKGGGRSHTHSLAIFLSTAIFVAVTLSAAGALALVAVALGQLAGSIAGLLFVAAAICRQIDQPILSVIVPRSGDLSFLTQAIMQGWRRGRT
jgi:O-antigen/teichoic acid export membrane protein